MFREAALALFLIAVALGLWLADVRPLAVVGVMALALVVAWLIEWVSWREDQLQAGPPAREMEQATEIVAEPVAVPEPAPAPAPRARGLWLRRQKRTEQPRGEPEAGLAVPETATAPETDAKPRVAAREEAPASVPQPVAEKPTPPQPPPSKRRLKPVQSAPSPPQPPTEPEPSLPPPEPEPEVAPVVPLWVHSPQPREWNLWELERIARSQSRRDPERFEEWSYLFLHLRRFANADGMLPAEFDGLVRDYFGGLLEPAQPA
jgi:hypothetical protein